MSFCYVDLWQIRTMFITVVLFSDFLYSEEKPKVKVSKQVVAAKPAVVAAKPTPKKDDSSSEDSSDEEEKPAAKPVVTKVAPKV